MRADDGDRAAVELVTMTVGAVEDGPAPPLAKTGNCRDVVAHAHGEDDAQRVITVDIERSVGALRDALNARFAPRDGRVDEELLPADACDVAGRMPSCVRKPCA